MKVASWWRDLMADSWDILIAAIIFATVVALLLIAGFLTMGRSF